MILGRYRLLAQLGAGRDGVRYEATDSASGERVEVRVLGPARSDTLRWPAVLKRLKSAAMLDHPTAIRVLELSPDPQPPFVAIEFVEGPTLADRHNPKGWDRTVSISLLIDLSRGMAAAHRLGLVHGGISPTTIRLSESMVPKIDWTGLQTGSPGPDPELLGPACRPPEATGPGYIPDTSADLFGLGVLLVWLLSGTLPWDSEFRLDDSSLDSLAKKLLAIDPLERPAAREVAMSLDVWRSVTGSAATAEIDCHSETQSSGLEFVPAVRLPSVPSIDDSMKDRQQIGRFKLFEKLGQGGMGSVYRAVDLADGREVAIKMLSPSWSSRPESLKRFLKEARMLAEVNSPHVTNFIEINEDDGLHYLAIEFVRGINLADWINRSGKADESTALAIMADVARALAVAHERSIVHRDVKPENILLVEEKSEDERRSILPRVKLSDFGLARHVVENESLVMTQVGSILGTPLYMAPEQCAGDPIDARTDVYAMGATLFHLLAGRPPFLGPSPLAVISMHRNEPPPALQDLNAAVSDGVAQIVAKSLAKAPSQRYSDASSLLIDLERLLRGEPTGIGIHPTLPDSDPKDIIQFDWRFDLEASPWQLWPHVSNTDRLNKAVGIPAVKFSTEPDPKGGVKRFGEFHKMGIAVAWQEHPFEWVEGRRLGILREYTEGPFRWFVSVVELAPKLGGGTTLHHRVRVSTRGLLGRTLAAVEIGVKGKRGVDQVYHRIDAAILGKLGRDASLDPFEPPAPLPKDKQAQLDRWLGSLATRGLDPTMIERFGEFLGHAPAQEVSRIRPLALARRLGIDPEGVVTACLLGAKEGILSLLWDLLCPICRIPSQVIDTLRALRDHGNCVACQLDFEVDFANSVELIFRVHPEIRPTDVSVYCVGGPAQSPHVVAQARISSRERVEIDLDLGEGHYRFRGPQLPFSIDFRVEPKAPINRWDLSLSRPPGNDLPRILRTGGQVLSLANDLDREVVVRVERIAPRDDALTAGRASTLALFRELFPSELLEPGQLVNIAMATFVVTELVGAGKLYDLLGDARAFALIHEHFRRIEAVVRREGGALIKTIEEGVFAAFTDPVSAVQAVLDFSDALHSDTQARETGLMLRVGVHRGPSMVATLNDHLDYFGTTVRVAALLPKYCQASEIVISQAVASDPRVADLIVARGLASEVIPAAIHGLKEGFLSRLFLPSIPAEESAISGSARQNESARLGFATRMSSSSTE